MTAMEGPARSSFTGRMTRAAGAALLVLLAAAAGAQKRAFTPVTDAMLQDPDPADWLNWRRTLDGWGYSLLDQIDRGNVHELQLAWGWPLPPGLIQSAPLVHDGIMFVPSPRVVQAVDAVTGDRLWEYRREFEASDTLEAVGAGMRTRSIAIYGDKIYVNTSDAHIVALDARTGEVAWDHAVADFRLGYRYTSGPIVVNGLIVAGMTGCQNYKNDVCFISAHDPETGEQAWRTSTIARPRRARRRHLGRPPPDVPGRRRLVDPRRLRPRDQPHLLVHVAGQAVGAGVAQDRRRRPLHEQRARARPRDGRAAVVLPVRAGRDPRPRRRVRERAHRPPGAEVALQDGQARHPVGARPRDRGVHGRPRPRLPERPRRRPRDRRGDLPARDDPRRRRRARLLPRLRRRPQLAGRAAYHPGTQLLYIPHPPDLRAGHVHRAGAGRGQRLLRRPRLVLAGQPRALRQCRARRPPHRHGHRHRRDPLAPLDGHAAGVGGP